MYIYFKSKRSCLQKEHFEEFHKEFGEKMVLKVSRNDTCSLIFNWDSCRQSLCGTSCLQTTSTPTLSSDGGLAWRTSCCVLHHTPSSPTIRFSSSFWQRSAPPARDVHRAHGGTASQRSDFKMISNSDRVMCFGCSVVDNASCDLVTHLHYRRRDGGRRFWTQASKIRYPVSSRSFVRVFVSVNTTSQTLCSARLTPGWSLWMPRLESRTLTSKSSLDLHCCVRTWHGYKCWLK